ncbi:phosphoribosylglycinamide formyltransferase 2, partial [Mycobacterium sp. ITM-2017-0098]
LLVRGDEVYFSDVRPRLQDAGLVTLRSQRLSQYELHARAVLGLPVDTIMISPGAVEVTYGDADSDGADAGERRSVLADALAVAESDIRVFEGEDAAGGSVWSTLSLATAPDPIVARDRARRVATALRRHRVTG